MTEKIKLQWKFLETGDAQKIAEISKIFSIPDSIANIFYRRGIFNDADAKKFFYPTKKDLHSPFLMKGMAIAVDRILKAIEKKDKVLVYGDYDVDGTNGTAMLYLFLQKLGLDVNYFIPDRIKDGYGLTDSGIKNAENLKINLIVAVDCGTTAVKQVELANNIGIDVIICDHHVPDETLPNAIALLNPMQKDCQYPFKFLCGCGVGFKFICAIIEKLNLDIEPTDYLDFVALATTADVVPMIDENRIFVKLGLEKLNNFPRPGISALINFTKIKPKQLNSSQIVFQLGPRINAVGRLGDAARAVHLLISKDDFEASECAKILDDENKNRREIDESVFKNAISMAEKYIDEKKGDFFVLYDETWHSGVVGIVASRIVEKFHRPAILLANIDGIAKGSARSINGFDLHEALKKTKNLLLSFGGHKHAAGLSLNLDNIEQLRDILNDYAKNEISDEIATPSLEIDSILDINDINLRIMKLVNQFEPFGNGNLTPRFLLKNVSIYGFPTLIDKNNQKHLKFKLKNNGTLIDCIGFGLGDFITEMVGLNDKYELVFTLDENNYQGRSMLQLKIRDIKISSNFNNAK